MLRPALALLTAATLLGPAPALRAQGVASTAHADFPNFESGPVRPLLLSADGATLYALNTPDHRLEIYATGVRAPGDVPELTCVGAVFTGLEPVAMAAHPDDPDILFVANHVSDSVSVVDVSVGRVLATIPVGDEPQDLLVTDDALVVACARTPLTPDLVAPADFVDNSVVFVGLDAPWAVQDVVGIPGHRPRALALRDGVVLVVPQNSGNHTTVLSEEEADDLGLGQLDLDAFDTPFELNPVLASPDLSAANGFLNTDFLSPINGWRIPTTGRIVFDHEYPALVPQLEDRDVQRIDATTRALLDDFTDGVGTTLLGMALNPVDASLWVVGTDARNRTRFEPVINGAAHDNRVSIVDADGSLREVVSLAPPFTGQQHAQPVSVAFSAGSGRVPSRAYVAALGSSTVVVLDAASGALVDELDVGLLPLGLAVDDAHGLLYVFTRGDNTIQAYDLASHAPAGRPRPLAYDPEPAAIASGRIHMYDARSSSGAGTDNLSCASCHVFGHTDGLAWDLGNPEGGFGYFFPDIAGGLFSFEGEKLATKKSLMTHPMKGPMVTQSLRNLGDTNGAPFHWRGDRRFFHMFQGAFEGLLGGSGISDRAMQEYTTFVESLTFAGNPLQPRDREHVGAAADGRDTFGATPGVNGKPYNPLIPGNVTCDDCHRVDLAGGSDFSGSQATVNFDGPSQLFNSATLRGMHEKEFWQLTGFGTAHDGSLGGLLGFLEGSLGGNENFPLLDAQDKLDVVEFMKAWDTGVAPLVGVQHSADAADVATLQAFLDLAEARAELALADIDLIAHVQLPGATGPQTLGLLYGPLDAQPGSPWVYTSDTGRSIDRAGLVQLVGAGVARLHLTCVPPGTGRRLALDRDEDGLLDGVERFLGTSTTSPDTDADGYDDGLEHALGSNPRVADAFLPGDVTAPTVELAEARQVFANTATLHARLDEPARVQIDLGSSAGASDLGVFSDEALRRRHDVILDGLPAGSEVFFQVTARDTNGNAGVAQGSFTTAPPLFRVADMTLQAEGTGPYTMTATVTVVDQDGAPVEDLPVRLLWAGDLGGADYFPPVETTGADGVATFVHGPIDPAGPTTISCSPSHMGSNNPTHAFFIGLGGDEPTFFYDQSANGVNYRSVELP